MADIKPDKIFVNYIPGMSNPPGGSGQGILGGNQMQETSIPGRAFDNTVNIDKEFVAGEAINAGQVCGMWGYITQTDSAVTATQATMVLASASTTNYDGTSPMVVLDNGADDRQALLSWSGLSADPSGTGITILTREIRFTLEITEGGGAAMNWHENNASFAEATVTWDTKPATTVGGDPEVIASGGGNPFVSEWKTVTSAELVNIRANGITLISDSALTGYAIADEDQASPPKLEVRYVYERQDDRIYLSSGLLQKHADGFRGFAQNSVTTGGTVKVRVNGVDSNQSSLTAHSDYELSDTNGSIQTGTSATWDKVVCTALDTQQVQINYKLSDAAQI